MFTELNKIQKTLEEACARLKDIQIQVFEARMMANASGRFDQRSNLQIQNSTFSIQYDDNFGPLALPDLSSLKSTEDYLLRKIKNLKDQIYNYKQPDLLPPVQVHNPNIIIALPYEPSKSNIDFHQIQKLHQ